MIPAKSRIAREGGFTLIELTLVAAILGILGSIAIPRFSEMIIKAQESSVRSKLGTMRSVLNIYYANTEGEFPTELDTGLDDQYINFVPSLYIPAVDRMDNPGHLSDNIIETDEPVTEDSGGWVYYTNDSTIVSGTQRIKKGKGKAIGWTKKGGSKLKYLNVTPFGTIFIDCVHMDTNGRIWSTY
jgi:prepilin-type N-terminal cleavage/methylation domain-containing protein